MESGKPVRFLGLSLVTVTCFLALLTLTCSRVKQLNGIIIIKVPLGSMMYFYFVDLLDFKIKGNILVI